MSTPPQFDHSPILPSITNNSSSGKKKFKKPKQTINTVVPTTEWHSTKEKEVTLMDIHVLIKDLASLIGDLLETMRAGSGDSDMEDNHSLQEDGEDL